MTCNMLSYFTPHSKCFAIALGDSEDIQIITCKASCVFYKNDLFHVLCKCFTFTQM